MTVECTNCGWQGRFELTDSGGCPECGGEVADLAAIYADANVVSLGFEPLSVVDFIKAEGGKSNTETIAGRFGWSLEQTRNEMRQLEVKGLVKGELQKAPGASRPGAMLRWEVLT